MNGRAAIETERLLLRDYRPADLLAYAALCADPEVMTYLGGPQTAEHARREMAAISRFFAESGFGMLAVERKSDGAFLGMCGLSVEPWYPDDLQIGRRFFPQFWGQDYATEAALAWRDLAFAVPVPRLISISDAPNLRSHRVMQRIGMRHDRSATLPIEGEQVAVEIYALTHEDWRSLGKLGGSLARY